MVNNSTNINKRNHHLSNYWIQKKSQHIWRWKSRVWLGTGIWTWRGWTGQWDANPPLDNGISNDNTYVKSRQLKHGLYMDNSIDVKFQHNH